MGQANVELFPSVVEMQGNRASQKTANILIYMNYLFCFVVSNPYGSCSVLAVNVAGSYSKRGSMVDMHTSVNESCTVPILSSYSYTVETCHFISFVDR